MGALTMIGQHFDHAAGCNMAVAAAVHHQFQLGLQSCEASDAVLDIAKAALAMLSAVAQG